jgi:hypothetical protein
MIISPDQGGPSMRRLPCQVEQDPSVDVWPAVNTARGGTTSLAADRMGPATTVMHAPSAGVPSTLKRLAIHTPDPMAKWPRYLHDMIWSLDEPCSSPTAKSSLFASPMPSPTDSDFIPATLDTLNARPDLFAIIMPINVSAFEDLLQDHPNQPFVVSVLRGLREGFWPGTDTSKDGYPLTWDFSHRPLANEEHIAFVQGQVDEEVHLSQFSLPFGPDLLPGMYSTPIHVVPKPHSMKLRLIMDHSAGSYLLNSMIDLSDTTGVKLDGMRSLGLSLLQFRCLHHQENWFLLFLDLNGSKCIYSTIDATIASISLIASIDN